MAAFPRRPGRAPSLCLLLLASAAAAGCSGSGRNGADVASRLRIASVAEASGQTDVAMSVLSSLASTAPENVDVQARYARALARAGSVQEADAAVSQALRRKPGDPVLLTELGRIRLLEGRAGEAADAFGAVLAARPRELGAMLGRGIAQDLLGQHPQAQASYRTVLAADPQNMPALNNLALSMVLAGDPNGAVSVLQPLATRSDAPPRVRNNLSVAQAAAGGQGLAPIAAAGPTRIQEDTPLPRIAASPGTAWRDPPPLAAAADRDAAATPVAFAPGTGRTGAFGDNVVAMEPIPDRPRRPAAKPVPAPAIPVSDRHAAPPGE